MEGVRVPGGRNNNASRSVFLVGGSEIRPKTSPQNTPRKNNQKPSSGKKLGRTDSYEIEHALFNEEEETLHLIPAMGDTSIAA